MFLYLHGFKTCRVNILMKVLHHLSQGLKWFLTYSWYFDSALLWCSRKYSYKKMCTWFHFRQQQKMKSFKELHVVKRLQKWCQYLQRQGCISSQIFNVEVPKKRICTRKFFQKEAKCYKKCYTWYDQKNFHRLRKIWWIRIAYSYIF